MAQALKIQAEPREERGKNAARRARRSGRVPAVVYGGDGETIAVSVDPRQLQLVLDSESGRSAILALEIHGGESGRVMLRQFQTEPLRGRVLHADFVRIRADERLRVKVPIHITGEAKGVKLQGGIFEFVLREVEVECLPDDIPENIKFDISELMIGQNVRVSDLPAGANAKVVTDPHRVVAHVVALKAEEEKPAEGVEVAATAEPELIRKPKAEEGEAPAAGEGGKAKESK